MSRYVKRCHGPLCNGRVLGNSSFKRGASVAEFCRPCEDAMKWQAKRERDAQKLAQLEASERLYVDRLAKTRAAIRSLRWKVGVYPRDEAQSA